MLPRQASAVLVLRRTRACAVLTPAVLAFDWSPGRLNGHDLALHLVPLHGVTPNPQRPRLAEQDCL